MIRASHRSKPYPSRSTGKRLTLLAQLLLTLFAFGIVAKADLFERLGLRKPKIPAVEPANLSLTALSQDQIVEGLKEALGKGVHHAVSQLGREGGFMNNLNVKIPMPEKLRAVEKTLRTLGQDQMADDFVLSMNSAAEKAVPEAGAIFGDAIKQMSIADAKSILTGTNTAATQYFRRVTETNLFARFHPVITKSIKQVGFTELYKRMTSQANTVGAFGGFFGARRLTQLDGLDVDQYVTAQALDGLFKTVAEEEKRIRENPVARTTDLLQKVFSTVAK